MTASKEKVNLLFRNFTKKYSYDDIKARISPKPEHPLPPPIRSRVEKNKESLSQRWNTLLEYTDASDNDRELLADSYAQENRAEFDNNIENYIGTTRIPLGVLGPLRVNGLFAQGDYYVPLATTEATLVASHSRGAKLISACGGCSAALINSGISRTPAFAFETVLEAGLFSKWVIDNLTLFEQAAASTTRYGALTDIRPHIEGNHVYLICEFATGDASGQNISTIATEAICGEIITHSPHKPNYWFLESNFSGDKKAAMSSFFSVRGKKAIAEIVFSEKCITEYLHTNRDTLLNYWRMSVLGGVMSGTIGVQGHYANGLTAVYLATGQDAACAAESGVGITRMEAHDKGLYMSVTLPNIMVGTVGGGTKLPTQSAGLRILRLEGPGNVEAFAEVCAALCLAGEISLIASICAGEFASAHKQLARGNKSMGRE